MASRIGSDLRRARTRREIDFAEVEAAIRIRGRFLRAIENEEWDALPGGAYTRSFIRTYANFLSLDGERLAEDYRREVEGGHGVEPAPVIAAAAGEGRAKRLRSAPWSAVLAIGAVTLVAAVAIFALPGGGDKQPGSTAGRQTARGPGPQTNAGAPAPADAREPTSGVSMRLTADGEVWVCVLAAGGKPLVDGRILEAGAAAGPFHSSSFTLSFGNGEVTMLIDGKQAEIPATSSPIGYSIDSSGRLTELSEAERPTCA